MATDRTTSNYLLVAAIDFGTTFSGYAFSTRFDYESAPLNISSITWTAGSGNLQSPKTSTCILFDPDGNFDSFGFAAEDKFSELAEDDEHKDWYYFKRFKMQLYDRNIDKSFMIKAYDGKQMKALKIFSSAIGFLKKELMSQCNRQGAQVDDKDILWVITVPAIWSEPAKQFMREAANEASIPNDQLKLVLEPEAAAIYCNKLPLDKMVTGEKEKMGVFTPGSKYLVLDAGGGTIDITVQEVQTDGKLKEVHKATGGDWGGTMVDREFESQLQRLAGNESFEAFKTNKVADWLILNRSFEVKKREEIPEDWVTFRIPFALLQEYRKMNHGKDPSTSDLQWKNDKLRISSGTTKALFQKSCSNIIKHMEELLKHPKVKDTIVILMVGGFSECAILQNAIKTAFPKLKVIVPNEASLCVLKGAVLYGHAPTIITERICRMTYGLAVSGKFKPGIDKDEKRIKGAKGDDRCIDVFKAFLKTDDSVTIGTPTSPHTFKVSGENATGIDLPVYASTEKAPRYVTDDTCQKLGMLKIEIPNSGRGADRGVQVQMIVGGSEIEVKAIDIHTQEEHKAQFSFLA